MTPRRLARLARLAPRRSWRCRPRMGRPCACTPLQPAVPRPALPTPLICVLRLSGTRCGTLGGRPCRFVSCRPIRCAGRHSSAPRNFSCSRSGRSAPPVRCSDRGHRARVELPELCSPRNFSWQWRPALRVAWASPATPESGYASAARPGPCLAPGKGGARLGARQQSTHLGPA